MKIFFFQKKKKFIQVYTTVVFLCFLLQCVNEGDIVIGKVAFKRPFGIIVTLTMLEFGCKRDFTDLDIQVFGN